METATFKSKGPRMIYVQRLGERIRFDGDGLFQTDNPKLIKALKRNRNTELVSSKDDGEEPVATHKEAKPAKTVLNKDERKELEQELTPASNGQETEEHDTLGDEDDEQDGGSPDPDTATVDPDDHTRPVLDALAEREGIDPKKYGNKRLLADAINAKRNE